MTQYKSMDYYLNLPWTYETTWSDDPLEPWTVRIKELQGCMTHGVTPIQAMQRASEAITGYIKALIADNEDIPEPVKPTDYKGNFSVRTTPDKHFRIAQVAQRRKTSINKLINEVIEKVIEEAS